MLHMDSDLKRLVRSRDISVYGDYKKLPNINFEEVNKYELFNQLILGDHVNVGLNLLTNSFTTLGLHNVLKIVGFGGDGHKDLWAHTCQVVKQAPKDRTIRIAALYHDVGKPDAFKFKNKITFHGHERLSVKKMEKRL